MHAERAAATRRVPHSGGLRTDLRPLIAQASITSDGNLFHTFA